MLPLTPPQTVGPFFAILVPETGTLSLATDATPGSRLVVEGTIRDGAGHPVPDALVEIWQANAKGVCNHPDDPRSRERDAAFDGFGRIHTDTNGAFVVETIRPGSVPGPDGGRQAPHLVVGLFARGLLSRLVTRVYFEDEPSNSEDPILAQVPADRRSTLIATRRDEGRYQIEIVIQGAHETVFFEV